MLLTIILILILLFIIYNIRIHIKWGKIYYTNHILTFNEISYCLKLLRDANVGAIASIIFPKAQLKFEIVKTQNEKEWWFELQVKKSKRNLFDKTYAKYFKNEIINKKRKVTYNIGHDVNKIYSFLEEVFIKNLKVNENMKISISFNNTSVLNGIDYYKKNSIVTNNN